MFAFLKIYPHTPQVTPQWFQSDRKVTQSHSNIPKVTPKCPQSDPKVPPKWPQPPPGRSGTVGAGSLFVRLASSGPLGPVQKCFKNQCFFNFSRFRPHQARTCMHDTCITHEIRRRHTQSNLKVTPKCPKNYFHMPKVAPKWPQSDPKLTPEFLKIINLLVKWVSFENRPSHIQSDSTMTPK